MIGIAYGVDPATHYMQQQAQMRKIAEIASETEPEIFFSALPKILCSEFGTDLENPSYEMLCEFNTHLGELLAIDPNHWPDSHIVPYYIPDPEPSLNGFLWVIWVSFVVLSITTWLLPQ